MIVISKFQAKLVSGIGVKNNKLPATEQNFLFKSCKIWNTFAKDIFEEANSDLSALVTIIKDRLTKILLNRGIDRRVALTESGRKVSFKYNKFSQYN